MSKEDKKAIETVVSSFGFISNKMKLRKVVATTKGGKSVDITGRVKKKSGR